MTPRAIVKGAGLPGSAQEAFPESAKHLVRNIVLIDGAVQIWHNNKVDDGGGDSKQSWERIGPPAAGRIDELGKRGTGGQLVAEQINEATTHIVSLDPAAEVDTNHRVEVEGKMWVIVGNPIRSGQATVRLQVRELNT